MPKYRLLFLFTLSFLLSYFREQSFLSLNATIEGTLEPIHWQFWQHWPSSLLPKLKWVLTVFYTLSFGGLTWLIMQSLPQSQRHPTIFRASYLGLIGFTLLLGIVYIALGRIQFSYTLFRFWLGILQSPFPGIALWITFKYLMKPYTRVQT